MTAAWLSAAVSAIFAAAVYAQYRRRRRPYQEAWAIGLAMFSVAAAAGALARVDGATEDEYRLFYLFGAILNVAWLALGTLHIVARRAVGDAALVFLYAFSAVAVIAVFTTPVDLRAALDTGKGFDHAPFVRALAVIGSAGGSVILIGGALWSAWRFIRARAAPRRTIANVVIAIGVFIAAAGGTAAFTGASGIVEWTNLVGVSVMFVGFLLAS